METLPVAEIRLQLAEVVNHVAYAKERYIVTKRGKEVAAIVPMEDIETLEKLEDQLDLKDALEALKEAHKKGTHSWKDIKKYFKL